MADENKNTGPAGSTPTQKSAVELKDTLKELLKIQGDYRDSIRDSVRELERSLKAYDKMEAKLVTINKSTINIKEIEEQIKKNREQSFKNQKDLADVEKRMSETGKERARSFNEQIAATQRAEETVRKARESGNKALEASALRNLNAKEAALNKMKEDLNVEELKYAQLLKTKQLNDDIEARQTEQLQREKEINKNIGISGYLAKQFADKLGIGNEFFTKLVEKTREQEGKLTGLQKATLLWNTATGSVSNYFKKLRDDPAVAATTIVAGFNKMGNAAKAAANGVGDFMKMSGDQVIGKLTGSISGLVSKIPIVGGLLGGLVEGFGKLLELSLAEDDKVVKIGRDLGVSKDQATAINDRFLKMAVNSKSISVNSANLLQSQKDLSAQLGVNNILSEQILKTDTELSKMMGLDAKTRASIAESSILTGKSSESITKSVFGQVGALKAATGISFDYKKVLAEASNFSGVLGLQFAKYPDKLAKSLVSIKSMGLEMNKLDSMADKFLSFESSISQEFEAQLLTGKQLNLSKAREAFLNNDLATAAKEITRQVGNSSEFMKMNRIQQESLASAMGMSRDEMADMLKKQEMLSKLGAKDLKEAQAKVEALKAQGKSRAEITKMVGEEAYNNLTNASAQEKIAGFMEKIQGAVANFLSKSPIVAIIDRAMNFLNEPDSINKIVTKIQGFFAGLFDVMGGIAGSLMSVANVFGADIDESLIRKVKKGGSFVRGMNLTGGAGVGENAAKERVSGETAAVQAQRQITAPSGQPTVVAVTAQMAMDPKVTISTINQYPQGDGSKMNPGK